MTAIVIAPHHRPVARSRRLHLAPVADRLLVPTGTAPAEAAVAPTSDPARPPLVLVPGGRVAAARRRRRALGSSLRSLAAALPGAAALAVVALLVTTVAALVLATTGTDPVPVDRAPSVVAAPAVAGPAAVDGRAAGDGEAVVPVAARAHVVQPGDTLWGIARSLQPTGDVRPLVDELSRRVGSAGLQPGQRLSLDGLDGPAGR